MVVKTQPLIKVQTLSRKLARQIRQVYSGAMDPETDRTAKRLYELIRNRKIGPIAWMAESALTGLDVPSSREPCFWLVEQGHQLYLLERPYPGHHEWVKGFSMWDDLPQIFIS